MYRIAICDDEESHRALAKDALLKFHYEHGENFELLIFKTAQELLEAPATYNILLLDIRLDNEHDGVEIARKLKLKRNPAAIILITSFGDLVHSRHGYYSEAVRYLEKPIKQIEFNEAMRAALNSLQASPRLIMLKSRQDHYFIPVEEIAYFEGVRHKKRACYGTPRQYCEFRSSWDELLEQLPQNSFAFIQKCLLVKISYVRHFTRRSVTLADGTVLNLSAGKYQAFIETYKDAVREGR